MSHVYILNPEGNIRAVLALYAEMPELLALNMGESAYCCTEAFDRFSKKVAKRWYQSYFYWTDISRWGMGAPNGYAWKEIETVPKVLELALMLGDST